MARRRPKDDDEDAPKKKKKKRRRDEDEEEAVEEEEAAAEEEEYADEEEVASRKAGTGNDAYTGMLVLTLVALLAASVLLYLDHSALGAQTVSQPSVNVPALGAPAQPAGR